MKTLLPLLILLLFAGCGESPEQKDEVFGHFEVPKWNPRNFSIQVTTRKEKWNENEYIDLTMRVTNISKKNASFGIMNGAWLDQWSISDPRIYVKIHVALKNYPVAIELEPGESYEMNTSGNLRAQTEKEIERITFDVGFSGLRRNEKGQLIYSDAMLPGMKGVSMISYRHPDACISPPVTIEIHKESKQNKSIEGQPIQPPRD